MFSNAFWILAVIGFIAQILCCIYGKNKFIQMLPMLIVGAVIVLTVILGSMGILSMILLVTEILLLAVVAGAYALCKLVFFAKK